MDTCMQHGHMHAAWTWACSMDTGMQHEHGEAAWTRTCSMDMDMMLGDHCSIVALFNAFDSSFSLFLQSFPRKGHRWRPLWPSPPLSSQTRTVSWCFYYKDNIVVKAMWSFQTEITIFREVIALFPKGSIYRPHPVCKYHRWASLTQNLTS